jgi:hypothetical protein
MKTKSKIYYYSNIWSDLCALFKVADEKYYIVSKLFTEPSIMKIVRSVLAHLEWQPKRNSGLCFGVCLVAAALGLQDKA